MKVTRGERTFDVFFAPTGTPVGAVTVSDHGKVLAEAELADDVRDSYVKWKDDPRFKSWMTDARFRYLISKQDREQFGARGQ